jgi:hypothetical protein
MASVELSDIVLRLMEQFVKERMYTSTLATVLNTDNFGEDQTIDVQPDINNVFDDGVILELPPILDVPVQFPSAGGGIMSFPIKKGDTVLLVFSMHSLDEWMEGKAADTGSITPADRRMYNLNDAIAIPGVYTKHTNLSPNITDTELKFNELSIKLEEAGDVSVSNPTHSLKLKANGDVLHSSGAKITAAGDFITASGISLDNHVHVGSATAPDGPVSNTGAAQ